MIKVENGSYAQGDLLFYRVDTIPNNVSKVNHINNEFIVSQSETGHDHVVVEMEYPKSLSSKNLPAIIPPRNVQIYQDNDDPTVFYKHVKNTTSGLIHKRDYRKHGGYVFDDGKYKFHRQIESNNRGAGWRFATD